MINYIILNYLGGRFLKDGELDININPVIKRNFNLIFLTHKVKILYNFHEKNPEFDFFQLRIHLHTHKIVSERKEKNLQIL